MLRLPFLASPEPLLAHQVHLWLCDLSQLEMDKLSPLQSLLSVDELRKVENFKRRRAEALATRLFVRFCLAHYTQQAPEKLSFALSEQGKPELLNFPFRFNLSHSENYLLLGVTLSDSIGVDLQQIRKGTQYVGIAERYFHPTEIERLKQFSGDQQKDYFYRLWTLKEAFFKALGSGIATGLNKACFEIDTPAQNIISSQDKSLRTSFDVSLQKDESDWQFAQMELLEDFHASVAVQQTQPIEIKLFDGNQLFLLE